MNPSLLIGLQALRVNPLRTLLSTLGVIMGVGAMVSVLSMGDGVEQFSREQIARTTDLLAVALEPRTTQRIDDQNLPRPDTVRFTAADVDEAARWPGVAFAEMMQVTPALAQRSDSSPRRGARVLAATASIAQSRSLVVSRGRFYERDEVGGARRVAVLSAALDAALGRPALGDSIQLNGVAFTVVGALAARDTADHALAAYVPLGALPSAAGAPRAGEPSVLLKAKSVEDVHLVKEAAERWLPRRVGRAWQERVEVRANETRLQQTVQAMMVFKLLMAAITGVSLLVGGVGIMNVMLASVAERTREIGVRKALGARNRQILTQFLAESVAITSAGAALGTGLGVAVAEVAAYVMRVQTKAPVQAALTPTTILVAIGASVTIGLSFGIYPAMRAARLSPIDAIRHE
ncbi:MAG: ABC transporter permease [Gemmatimonadaceae bacterium]